eukprot:TRINITY_DN33924_c0_g1_i1.p1 TRINITY_DN33924_c0_g1~~TRINITY_DN33924_c0_g1_i1.p1  ORF type:complete len:340 (+),score=51.04 TRINITY_DN33924_c0_g1_i1:46-1065(+)
MGVCGIWGRHDTSIDVHRESPPKTLANSRFEIQSKLGDGAFGTVYRGMDTETTDAVAIKLADQGAGSSLKVEAEVLKLLGKRQGFTSLVHEGREESRSYLVLDCLGMSLEQCMSACGGKINVRTVTLIAIQALQRLAYLHSKGIIHRDIKPENFMCGIDAKAHHLYLIDFGISTRYFEKEHVKQAGESNPGTVLFASYWSHRGLTQSRRDDLEAMGYMLMYLLRGSLPWSENNVRARNQQEFVEKIFKLKEELDIPGFCNGFPEAFEKHLQYSRASLKFSTRPDYAMLLAQFCSLREAQSPLEDYDLQWLTQQAGLEDLVPLDAPSVDFPQPDDVQNGS